MVSYRCGMTPHLGVSPRFVITHSEVSYDIHMTIICDDGDADDDEGDDDDYVIMMMMTMMMMIRSILNWSET